MAVGVGLIVILLLLLFSAFLVQLSYRLFSAAPHDPVFGMRCVALTLHSELFGNR
jgi:hypothetical protein